MKIITGMFAAGDVLFDRMANISIPSFLRSNVDTDLVFFTDRPELHTCLSKFKKLKIASYQDYYNKFPQEAKDFDAKIEHDRSDVNYGTHKHNALLLAMQPLILQRYGEENGYEWAIMVDIDSYFVGNLIEKLVNEISETCKYKHFYIVDQCHPAMSCQDIVTGCCGAGFQMWQIPPVTGAQYVQRYTLGFRVNHQDTVHCRMEDSHYLRYIKLIYPGYHLIYPFAANCNFNKQDAMKFIPGYFHIGMGQGGPDVIYQMKKFEEWFNPEDTFEERFNVGQ